MARPPAAKADARARLVAAADRLFYRDGLAAGIDAVIADAGVAKMTLYGHFRSKDELIVAYLRRRDEHVRAWFVDAVERHAGAAGDRLSALFAALKEWFASDGFRGCAFLNAAAELPDPAHPGRAVVAEHKRRFAEFVGDVLRQAGVRRAAAHTPGVMLLIEGAIVTAVLRGNPGPADEALAAARAMTRRPGRTFLKELD